MLKKLLKIRELKIDDTEETGVIAISMVDAPAIEENFIYFAKHRQEIWKPSDIKEDDLDVLYNWTLGDDEHCPSCIEWVSKGPKPLRYWINNALPRVPYSDNIILAGIPVGKGWVGEIKEPENTPYYNTLCRDACKCHLTAADTNMRLDKRNFNVEFKIENVEKKEIVGLVLRSGQMIYRHNVGDGFPGYVYFSRETVRNSFRKFGFNRNITFQHVQNKTGSAIMMQSWLDESETETRWMVKYKIIDTDLWEQIKKGVVKGYSVEASFH